MTLTIEVSGEQGLTADRVARRVLAQALTPGIEREERSPSAAAVTSGEENARAFVDWAKSHRDTPPLSDEAVSRAGMYPDRW